VSTGIQWTDETWLMWPGCVPASPGCANCYAVRDAWRMSFNPNPKVSAPYQGIVKKVLDDGTEILAGEDHPRRREPGVLKFTGLTRFLPERLSILLRWRKPRRIFVSANSDLFLPSRVATEEGRRQIAAVFGVMAACQQHTFQVLTKWPGEALKWFAWLQTADFGVMAVAADQEASNALAAASNVLRPKHVDDDDRAWRAIRKASGDMWPLPNVWIGTSVEDQTRADDRIPKLLQVPAALRFLSCEPLLGNLDLGCIPVDEGPGANVGADYYHALHGFAYYRNAEPAGGAGPSIDWVIVGGESNGRPCDVGWIRSIVEQCKSAGVPVFVKQLGSRPVAHGLDDCGPQAGQDAVEPFPLEGIQLKLDHSHGGDPSEWPEDLRVRQMPEAP
jgi:protein gp37